MEGWMLVASFFESFKEGVLTWLPLVFFGLLVYLVWRTLAIMPRVKPADDGSFVGVVGDLGRRRRRRGGARGVAGGRRVPARPEALRAARRARARRASCSTARRVRGRRCSPGRGARVGRELLLPERVGVRRDVRRARCRADPQALRHRAPQPARDRVHRRARRCRDASLGHTRTTASTTRPSTSFSSSSTASRTRVRSSSSGPRTGSRTSTRPCCGRAASIGRSSSRRRTWRVGKRSRAFTRAASRWLRRPI